MAQLLCNRKLSRSTILAFNTSHQAKNGCIYYASDGGIFIGQADGTVKEYANMSGGSDIEWLTNSEIIAMFED